MRRTTVAIATHVRGIDQRRPASLVANFRQEQLPGWLRARLQPCPVSEEQRVEERREGRGSRILGEVQAR